MLLDIYVSQKRNIYFPRYQQRGNSITIQCQASTGAPHIQHIIFSETHTHTLVLFALCPGSWKRVFITNSFTLLSSGYHPNYSKESPFPRFPITSSHPNQIASVQLTICFFLSKTQSESTIIYSFLSPWFLTVLHFQT